MTEYTEHRGVEIPNSADAWELYASKPGADQASTDLTATAKAAINVIADSTLANLGDARRQARTMLDKCCSKHADLGAADSEPLRHASQVIERAIRKFIGSEHGH